MKIRGMIARKILGIILGLTGAIIIIEFVPIKVWYIILISLIVLFFIILFLNL